MVNRPTLAAVSASISIARTTDRFCDHIDAHAVAGAVDSEHHRDACQRNWMGEWNQVSAALGALNRGETSDAEVPPFCASHFRSTSAFPATS